MIVKDRVISDMLKKLLEKLKAALTDPHPELHEDHAKTRYAQMESKEASHDEKPALYGWAIVEINYRQEYMCSSCGIRSYGIWNCATIEAKSLPEARDEIAKVERISKLSIECRPLDWIYVEGKFLCEKCKEEYYKKEME